MDPRSHLICTPSRRGHPSWFPLVPSDWGIWASPPGDWSGPPVQGDYPRYHSIMSPPRRASLQACVSQKTRKLLGPEDFSGLFSDEFFGSRKAFLNAPENSSDSHPSFSCCFLGFAARAWQWFVKNLNWHGCTELGSSRTLQIKPSFVDSFVESQANF